MPSTAVAVVLCLLASATGLFSQSPPSPPPAGAPGAPGAPGDHEETFFESIDVEVVNVEVYVTRRDGRPVTGLSRDDFQLFEDGKPVAVTNFYAVPCVASAAPDAATAPPAGEPAGPAAPAVRPTPTLPAAPAVPPVPEEQRLSLVVFVDDLNLGPSGRNQVLKQIRAFLYGRPRGQDRLLLVRYDGSLQVRQAPTDDPQALAAALEKVSRGAGRGAHGRAEVQRLLDELNTARSPEEARALLGDIETFAQRRQDEIRATVHAAGELVDELAGLPGRKALLYVSGGLSLEPGEALLRAFQTKFGGSLSPYARQLETGRLLTHLAERANANRITFYALGAIETVQGISAERGYNPFWTDQGLEYVERDNRAASLLTLAADTGGLASLDAGKAAPILDRMRGDLDSYYSLGFSPTHAQDGKLHRLEVRLRDRSLSVRHRTAYRANSTAEAMVGRTLAELALGGGDGSGGVGANPLGVILEILPQKGAGNPAKGERTVQVLVRFGLSGIALVPRDDVYEGRVRLFVAARDEKGGTSPVSEIAVPLSIPKEQLREALGKQAGYVATLKLRPGSHRIVVTLLDDVGKVSSTASTRLPAGPAKAAAGTIGSGGPLSSIAPAQKGIA